MSQTKRFYTFLENRNALDKFLENKKAQHVYVKDFLAIEQKPIKKTVIK